MIYRFIMNLKAENGQFIEKAATTTGFDVIVGKSFGSVEGFVGIYSGETYDTDFDPFWDEYERLKQNARFADPELSDSNLPVY